MKHSTHLRGRAAAAAAIALSAGAFSLPLRAQQSDTLPASAAASLQDAEDQALLDKVILALRSDPSLRGATIHVVVDSGKVALDGTANGAAQAAHVIEVAQTAAGPAVVVSGDVTPIAIEVQPVTR